MVQKVSYFVTLILTALTLVILLVFLSQSPNYEEFAKKTEINSIETSISKNVEKRLEGIENVNGLDQLNEKYNEIDKKNKELEAANNELKSQTKALQEDLDELKKKLNNQSKEPVIEEKPEVLKNETVTVNASQLNFRNSASLSAPIKTTLPDGTKLEVLNQQVIHKDGYKWVMVKLKNGDKGYVAREYVR